MSEDLQVQAEDLDELARDLRELSDQTETARTYLKRWLGLSTASGRAFVEITSAVQEVRDRLDANYSTLSGLTDRSAVELESAANMYRRTDSGNAGALNGTYAGGR